MIELLSQPVVLIAIFGVGVALVLLFFAFSDESQRKQAKRVDRLRTRGQEATDPNLQLRKDSGNKKKLDVMVRRMMPKPDEFRQKLYRTGKPITLGTYGIICAVVAVISTVGAIIGGLSLLIAIPVGLLGGLWLPYLAIKYLGNRRAAQFMKLFPEAIGLMVRGLKSGLPITETFQIVAQEIGDPVGIEFRQVTDQIRLGHPLEQALLDAAKRVGTPELKFLTVTLSIQRETGGNLAETLANLDGVLRKRHTMKLKVKAVSSEARASAMIIGALPFIMMGLLSIVNPDYISLLFTTTGGHKALFGGAVWMSIGIAVMAKMVRFEI
jgi:tight adherence protein B